MPTLRRKSETFHDQSKQLTYTKENLKGKVNSKRFFVVFLSLLRNPLRIILK